MAIRAVSSEGLKVLIQRLFRSSQSRISTTELNRREIALSAVKESVAMLEKEFSDNLVSVIAFGNFAKGKKFNGIDLLIVFKEVRSEQGYRQRIAQTIGERVFGMVQWWIDT